jgi:TetR/AcrR family transcriptional repressor of bet genes
MKRAANKIPANGRTATREARRRQLINATIDSIAKRGFSGTTLATVTTGAKLSHGIVNFHFDSKEDLYVETLGLLADEHYANWHGSMLQAGSDPARQLAAIIEADFDRDICSPKKLAVWFAFWGQAKYRPNYLEIHHRYDDERFAEISRVCGKIVADGPYDDLDPLSVARCIEALVDGLWLNLLLYPDEAARERARADCFGYFAQVFHEHFPRRTD